MVRSAASLRSTGLVLFAALLGPGSGATAQELFDPSLKANLDLPFNAVGERQDEEAAPERVVFFGQTYEASAIVWALDESGSMTENGRWELQTREVTRAIAELGEDAEFGVVYYGSRVASFRSATLKAKEANKSAAIDFVRSRRPSGDTCIGEGVVKALEIVRKSGSKHRTVIVTSDGRPDNCATGNRANAQEIEQIYQQTLKANPDRSVIVHTIWVGRSQDQEAIQFLRKLAQIHGGTFRMVSG